MSDDTHDDLTQNEALFHEALELDATERERFLAERLADDPEALAELRSLLSAHDRAPSRLEQPVWGLGAEEMDALFAAATEPRREVVEPGTRLGRYEVRRCLGEGGMGSVYLALQHEPLRRLVAIKLIKPGMDTREVVRRFASERQALARLNHPGIAAVHDAGMSEQGRPYFVMEYVAGERITEWCDERALDVRKRTELFLDVCRAAQHAHAQGIVHRDLKPSNVLVRDEAGSALPKIIDFGVAKATSLRGGHSTLGTRRGQMLGTPGYMSPEQAGAIGAEVDARSDVYSLGVLLFELLTGVLPIDRARLRSPQWLEHLSETPELASRRVGRLGRRGQRRAQRRGLSSRALVNTLRGDLDAILLCALQPKPEQRYASVADLTADLRAWLRGGAVRAPRAPWLHGRARRQTRRAAVGGLGLGLFLTGVMVWQPFAALPTSGAEETAEGAGLSRPSFQPQDTAQGAPEASIDSCAGRGWDQGLSAADASLRVLVRYVGATPLAAGSVLRMVGAELSGQDQVLRVDVASLSAEGPVVGVLIGALSRDRHADHEHLGRSADTLQPGSLGLAMGVGGVTTVLGTSEADGLRPGEALGLSSQLGRVVAHTGTGPVIGYVSRVAASGTSQLGIWVRPQLAIAPVETTLVVASEYETPKAAVTQATSSSTRPRSPGGSSGSVPVSSSPSFESVAHEPAPDAQPETWVSSPAYGGANAELLAEAQPQPLIPMHELPAPLPAASPTLGSLGGAAGEVDPTGGVDPELPGGEGGDDGAMLMTALKKALPATGIVAGLNGRPVALKDGLLDLEGAEVDFEPSTLEADVRWLDLQGDGRLDLLRRYGELPNQLFVQVLPGLFEDRSQQTNLFDFPGTRDQHFVDLDDDGRLDLVGLEESDELVVWLGAGDGFFRWSTKALGLHETFAARLAVFDIDGDELLDLQLLDGDGALTLLLNRGGVFEHWEIDIPMGGNPALPTSALGAEGFKGAGGASLR